MTYDTQTVQGSYLQSRWSPALQVPGKQPNKPQLANPARCRSSEAESSPSALSAESPTVQGATSYKLPAQSATLRPPILPFLLVRLSRKLHSCLLAPVHQASLASERSFLHHQNRPAAFPVLPRTIHGARLPGCCADSSLPPLFPSTSTATQSNHELPT